MNDGIDYTANEYKIWKKNIPFLYGFVLTHSLEWSSLTVEWFPDSTESEDGTYRNERLLIGTHAASGEMNYLKIVRLRLPLFGSARKKLEIEDYEEMSGYSYTAGHVETLVKINHSGEVNRARYMPQNHAILASKTIKNEIHIFDYTKRESFPSDDTIEPDLVLSGLDSSGYPIAWNKEKNGILASGDDDGSIALWDLSGNEELSGELSAFSKGSYHSDVLEDLAWHPVQSDILCAVSDDCSMSFWDMREGLEKPITIISQAHDMAINGVDFNPFLEGILATSSSDKRVRLWDMRNLAQPFHKLVGHKSEVYSIKWSPHSPNKLCSSGTDRRVLKWDLSRIGKTQNKQDAAEGPPELLFVHGGHTANITDISWNLNSEDTIASVDEDNIIQVWKPACG